MSATRVVELAALSVRWAQEPGAPKNWWDVPYGWQIAAGAGALVVLTAYLVINGRSKRADIKPAQLGTLNWASGSAEGSLESLKLYVLALGDEAAGWYSSAKKSDKGYALALRLLILFFSVVAGVLPVVSELMYRSAVQAPPPPALSGAAAGVTAVDQISPLWSTLALALAAGCFSLDRYFGFSKAWIRYVQAQTRIQSLMATFRIRWELERTCGVLAERQCEVSKVLIGLADKFVADMRKVIEEETAAWVDDFRQSLTDLENQIQRQSEQDTKKAKERADELEQRKNKSEPGVLRVVLTNPPAAGVAWKVFVDDDTEGLAASGAAAALSAPAGLRRVRVESPVPNAATLAAADAILVPPGGKVELKLTLA